MGSEDVLDGDVPPLPAQRTRFNRKRDYAALGLLVVALSVTGVVVWQRGDVRATASITTARQYEDPAAPQFFPPSLGEVWRAESPATWEPVVAGPTVVTGRGGEVAGRDPETGDVRWTYRRDLELCTITAQWRNTIALYRTTDNALPDSDPRHGGGCSEMTSLDSNSGERYKQRNSDAELGTRLIGDGVYLTATGERLLTTVRSDLVETMDFGQIPALVNADKQPRTGCTYKSTHAASNKIAVIERCPTDAAARLTVYKATGKEGEADKPVEVLSTVLGGESAQIVAMNDELTAVALPSPDRLVVFGADGAQAATYDLDLGPDDLRADPPGRAAPVTKATGAFHWFSGSRTVVVSATELRPLWTIKDTLGPGTVFAGRALIPVKDAIAVVSQADGKEVGRFPVDRANHTGTVMMSSIGPIVLEQRGTTLVALH
jgi:hypothetical protein